MRKILGRGRSTEGPGAQDRAAKSVSLRARIVATLLAVVSLGLSIAGVGTWMAVRSFEVARVDGELQLAQVPVAHALDVASFNPGSAARQALTDLPAGTFGAVVDGAGKPLVWVFPFGTAQTGGRQPPSPPAIPPTALGSGATSGGIGFSTSRYLNGASYRILSRNLPSGNFFVVGMPMTDVNGTLAHLALVETVVGAAVLVALGLAARSVVGVGLRPLGNMVDTAGAIAAGDLSRRVPAEGESTEIGRLGTALNEMLSRIEASFAARAASEERLRRFVADAGHELRTPLTSIRGYAELFRRGAAERPEDLALAMRRIEQESTRMKGLVEDLLLLAKLDERKSLTLRPIDLALIAADAVSDAHAVDPDRPVALHCPPRLEVLADEARIRQVLANLISNAIAHTPPSSPITVAVRRVEGRDGGLPGAVIEVADQGPGLTPEHAARVFERFYRADPSRSRSMGGSGLGLSIVAAIAEAHGGRAEVTSTPGKGAIFSVTIPPAGTPADLPAALRPQAARPDVPQAAGTTGEQEASEPNGIWVSGKEAAEPKG